MNPMIKLLRSRAAPWVAAGLAIISTIAWSDIRVHNERRELTAQHENALALEREAIAAERLARQRVQAKFEACDTQRAELQLSETERIQALHAELRGLEVIRRRLTEQNLVLEGERANTVAALQAQSNATQEIIQQWRALSAECRPSDRDGVVRNQLDELYERARRLGSAPATSIDPDAAAAGGEDRN